MDTNTLTAPDAPPTPARAPGSAPPSGDGDIRRALRFITCGSVDDGKSTLIGRLLLDSRAVLSDQLASVSRDGAPDLALFTDGLSAEREQGITIDVAWRYFATARRKFIIGDTPGHEQYTRNMVTAASQTDAAVVLVDATKLPWHDDAAPSDTHALLPQTRRHALLLQLLRVPSVVFAVNKLDAVADPARAFARIGEALRLFCERAGLRARAIVPISALHGHNVVQAQPGWCGYNGPHLLGLLESLPAAFPAAGHTLCFGVQWIEKLSSDSRTDRGRRILWGRVAGGNARVGQALTVHPGGQRAQVAEVLDHARQPDEVSAGHGAGIVLDREIDVSRGDWLLDGADDKAIGRLQRFDATVAWMDDEPLRPGRTYWALHGHRWVKARVAVVLGQRNLQTLAVEAAGDLGSNAIGRVSLALQEAIPVLPYAESRALGALVLVDTVTHRTAGAVLID